MTEHVDSPAPAIADEALPPRPVRPSPDECCKSNCSPCILEVYEQELERWERRVGEILQRRAQSKKP